MFGVTTPPPRSARGDFVFRVGGALIYDCSLTPGIFGRARNGKCMNAHPTCVDCGVVVARGTPLSILGIHDGVDRQTARIRVGTGAAAIIVDDASWSDLETIIAPAATSSR